MRLSNFSDYSVRVLLYLGSQPDRLATIAEIAATHGISDAHLKKVVHHLARAGYLDTVRGKGGGMRLKMAPETIVVGEVIRSTENVLELADCASDSGACLLNGACGLQGVLAEAMQALFLVLDAYTLADLLGGRCTPAVKA